MSLEAVLREISIPPGTLGARVEEATRRALASAALQPIATDVEPVEDGGIEFQVRILGELHRKETAERMQEGTPGANPFAAPDRDLVVAGLSKTHVCLLNKFNVVARHLLIVTREFADQDELLDQADFEALAICMREIDGLAFYNGGVVAGASQQHKHLQLVPPLGPGALRAPLEAILSAPSFAGERGPVPAFRFAHALARLRLEPTEPPQQDARRLAATYRALMQAIDCHRQPPPPHNILATRTWMLAVPRSREHFGAMSVNSLGFAGSLLVRDRRQLAAVRRAGPLAVLEHVGLPRAAS